MPSSLTRFFADLSKLRSDGKVDDSNRRLAEEACRGGTEVLNLRGLLNVIEKRYPAKASFFDCAISSADGFPQVLAAFVVSLSEEQGWSKVNQHGTYAVYGNHILKMLQACKGQSGLPEAKYRDELAGANQHYANGLMHGAKLCRSTDMIDWPCFDEPKSALWVAEEATRCMQVACSLRAEKYGSPGTSTSIVAAYKSTILNMIESINTLMTLQGEHFNKDLPKIIGQLQKKASCLSLGDKANLDAVGRGEVSQELARQLCSEKRVTSITKRVVPLRAECGAHSPLCKSCKVKPSTHQGFSCGCLCLCDDCSSLGKLFECQMCGDYTEFVSAPKEAHVKTMDQIVAIKNGERIEESSLFEQGGPVAGPPQSTSGQVVLQELTNLLAGETSAFYFAAQPIFKVRHGSFVLASEEILLRARNGTQSFPACTSYHSLSEHRRKFTLHQLARVAPARMMRTGASCGVNVWAEDLFTLKEEIKSVCKKHPNLVIELSEYAKGVDVAGFPTNAVFDERLPLLLEELHAGGVKLSIDDVNNCIPGHPATYEFALQVLPYIMQLKLDIKLMAQIFESQPNVPNAARFAPLETDSKVLAQKRDELAEFLDNVLERRPEIEIVVELSVTKEEIAQRFPRLNPFEKRNVMIQGGDTNDWGAYIQH